MLKRYVCGGVGCCFGFVVFVRVRWVHVLTLLFFLSVLSLQVRLSKNIQLTNIATWKRKERVEGKRNKSGRRVGEGLIIELTNGKKKSFDFEGKGCWALGDALNNTNYKE